MTDIIKIESIEPSSNDHSCNSAKSLCSISTSYITVPNSHHCRDWEIQRIYILDYLRRILDLSISNPIVFCFSFLRDPYCMEHASEPMCNEECNNNSLSHSHDCSCEVTAYLLEHLNLSRIRNLPRKEFSQVSQRARDAIPSNTSTC